MKYNSDESLKIKTIEWVLSVSSEVKKTLGRTHEEKVKLIVESDDMTTEEKLRALDHNDYQILFKIFTGGALITTLVLSIKNGKPIDMRFLEKSSKQLAA